MLSSNYPDSLAEEVDSPAVSPAPGIREKFSSSLGHILTPDSNGQVLFGHQQEPLRLSQIESLAALKNCVNCGVTLVHKVMPGGTGKTRTGTVAAYAMHQQERSSLFVVPSQHAAEDFSQKARALCPDLDVGLVYQMEKRLGRLTFITYASLLRCILGEAAEVEAREFEEEQGEEVHDKEKLILDPADYDLVIWDEAHWYLTPSAQRLVQRFRHAINLGMTATPRYYDGKEVANVFGEKIYELDLHTAKERKEICDYRNILIRTDIRTGLSLSSPEQEESVQVARAIDIPERNGIFPDVYLNAKITVGSRTFTLAGEKALVFCAGIDHVHDQAQAFNDLLPLLKTDENLRNVLRGKGINPDIVEQVAAPIHSGASDRHPAMNIGARNALIERYDQRKVLALVTTSVLQQSFDNPPTSVIMDTVSRQTYVGVGQAGMRALRWLPEKEMAFLINTEDADHRTLTFEDFEATRGREEGVIVEVAGNGTGLQSGKYSMTSGRDLSELAQHRQKERNQLHRADYLLSSRHFTEAGYNRINKLLMEIAMGNQNAVNEFTAKIFPWIERVVEYISADVLHTRTADEEVNGLAMDILPKLLDIVRAGKITIWNRFSMRFFAELRRRCVSLHRKKKNERARNLHARVVNVHVQSHIPEYKPAEIANIHEPSTILLHETLAGEVSDDATLLDTQRYQADAVEGILSVLKRRERTIVEMRLGIQSGEPQTLEEIGRAVGITQERVRQVYLRTLRDIRTAAAVVGAEFEDNAFKHLEKIPETLAHLKRQQAEHEANKFLLSSHRRQFLTQKEILKPYLGYKHLSQKARAALEQKGIRIGDVQVLTSAYRTNMSDLDYALHLLTDKEWSALLLKTLGRKRSTLCIPAMEVLRQLFVLRDAKVAEILGEEGDDNEEPAEESLVGA